MKQLYYWPINRPMRVGRQTPIFLGQLEISDAPTAHGPNGRLGTVHFEVLGCLDRLEKGRSWAYKHRVLQPLWQHCFTWMSKYSVDNAADDSGVARHRILCHPQRRQVHLCLTTTGAPAVSTTRKNAGALAMDAVGTE